MISNAKSARSPGVMLWDETALLSHMSLKISCFHSCFQYLHMDYNHVCIKSRS